MPPTNRAIVIYSPHSGRARHLEEVLSQLRQHNIAITKVIPIADLDGLPAQGPVWKAQGLDIAIAAGGDGLVGGVITHIAESGLALGIIPLGTANDVARTLQIPQDIQQATEVIINGHIIGVDVGVAQPAEQTPHKAKRHRRSPAKVQIPLNQQSFFAHALTVGLNVQFARIATNITTRQRFGRLTYPIAALEFIKHHGPIELDVQIDGLALPKRAEEGGTSHEEGGTSYEEGGTSHAATDQTQPIILTEPVRFRCKALQATVINAPIFGGQWQIALPKASIYDRLLNVVLITDIKVETLVGSIAHFLGNPNMPTNPHSSWHIQNAAHPLLQQAELSGIQGAYHFQAQGITISSNVDPQDVTLDGEIRGQTPVRIHIAPQSLPVIVPTGRA
jgi:diacylglycerol kinase (ATP)